MEPPVLVILGVTATGKSALAGVLARELDGEVINADALQVYRSLDIGTAKPSPSERQAVPHHLVDILDPREPYSAGTFAGLARTAIQEIRGRGRMPLVVGGSGLYLRALLEGISPLPPRDAGVRQRLEQQLAEEGLTALRAELQVRDPATAARLGSGDTQRIIRALEVALSTGRSLTSWIAEKPFGSERVGARRLGLTLPRAILYDRIADRVQKMLQDGWVEEVRRLLEQGYEPSEPAFQAIGYRQIVQHLREKLPLQDAVDQTIQATRRLAKRQATWFAKEPNVEWLPAQELDKPSLASRLQAEFRAVN